jgi:hypothetical protein
VIASSWSTPFGTTHILELSRVSQITSECAHATIDAAAPQNRAANRPISEKSRCPTVFSESKSVFNTQSLLAGKSAGRVRKNLLFKGTPQARGLRESGRRYGRVLDSEEFTDLII